CCSPCPARPGRSDVARNVQRLQTVFLGGFMLVALTLGYWQFFRQHDLLARATNPRTAGQAALVQRGRILDRTGTVLAEDAPNGPGRVYRSPADANVVGYHSERFGNSGIEARYDDYLSGARSADPIGGLKAGLLHEPTRGS